MSGNVAPPAVLRPCHLFLASCTEEVGGRVLSARAVFRASIALHCYPGCRHTPSTSPVLSWTPAGRLRGYLCFFIKAVGLKAAGDSLNTRKEWSPIYSVSTASSAGLVCSAWLQVTLGMVATTTSVHSTSPFSWGNYFYASCVLLWAIESMFNLPGKTAR